MTPLVAKQIFNGDCITLGCAVEGPNTANHLPTALEVSLLPMSQRDFDREVERPDQVSLPSFASNSFHAPDSESEDEQDNKEELDMSKENPWTAAPVHIECVPDYQETHQRTGYGSNDRDWEQKLYHFESTPLNYGPTPFESVNEQYEAKRDSEEMKMTNQAVSPSLFPC